MPVARQEHAFDPEDHIDPVGDLTLAIRRLKLGERIRLPNDILILSRSVAVGPHQQRRFTVVPAADASTALERHRVVALGYDACKNAADAAKKALG